MLKGQLDVLPEPSAASFPNLTVDGSQHIRPFFRQFRQDCQPRILQKNDQKRCSYVFGNPP